MYVQGVTFIVLCLAVVPIYGPVHASCRLTWDFGIPCKDVMSKLVAQMNLWKGLETCPKNTDQLMGEKCGYAIKSQTATQIKGTHTTPFKKYIDDLTMDFYATGNSCHVKGFSTAETWYAVLDYGTNYCNLHNLLTGAGLDKAAGYKETTSNSACTQYTQHDCDKY